MRAHCAAEVLLPDRVAPAGVVVVDDGGTIVEVRGARPGDPPPADGLLVPGLVNAHTHLELSGLAGRIGGGAGLIPWVRALLGERDPARHSQTLDAARAAHALGAAAVLDVSNGGDTAPAVAAAGLEGVVAHELLGMGPRRPEPSAPRTEVHAGRSIRVRPTAHATTTTAPDLLRSAARPGLGAPATVHVAEDPAERRFLADGTGPCAELLDDLGIDWSAWRAPGCSGVAYLSALGLLGPELLAVHCVDVDDADRARLAATDTPVCLCPRSNLHIGGRLPDAEALLAAGVRLCLGTDSLASTPDLDLLAEVAVLQAAHPSVRLSTWLRAATAGGASVLGVPDLGRISVGARPGLLLLEGVRASDTLTAPPPRRWLAHRAPALAEAS